MSTDASFSSQRSHAHQPHFNFRVECGEHGVLFFQDMSGLDRHSPALELRSSGRPGFSAFKGSVSSQAGIVTMKRGLSLEGRALWHWLNVLQRVPDHRTDMVVQLMDETGKPAMAWTLRAARPGKITAPGLTAASRELAIETMELDHDGVIPERT